MVAKHQVCPCGLFPKAFKQKGWRRCDQHHRWHLACFSFCPHCSRVTESDELVSAQKGESNNLDVGTQGEQSTRVVVSPGNTFEPTPVFVQFRNNREIAVYPHSQPQPNRCTELELLQRVANVVFPMDVVTADIMERAVNSTKNQVVLQTLKYLSESVCRDCQPLALCALGGLAFQGIVPQADWFGLKRLANNSKVVYCCFSMTWSNSLIDKAVTLRHDPRGQCEAQIMDANFFELRCQQPFQPMGLFSEKGTLVYFCKDHFNDAVNHSACACGYFFAPEQEQFVLKCINGHRFHPSCRRNNACPHEPCQVVLKKTYAPAQKRKKRGINNGTKIFRPRMNR